jgi:small-conductance mechanosensitive channel
VSEAYLAEPKIEAVLLLPAGTHKALFELARTEKQTLADLEAKIKAAKTFEEKREFKEAKKNADFEFQAQRREMLEKSLSGAQLELMETINLTAKKAVEDAGEQSGWSGMLPSDPTRAETEKKRKVLYKALFQEELEKLLSEDAKAALKNARISKD